jgi:hypothetical protein
MYRILLLIGLLSSSLGFSASTVCPENRCIAVVNAGNSGSRLHIYQFELDDNNFPIHIKNVFSKAIEPGLASINLNQKSINQYMSSLFSDVAYQNMPVYFYATSGMRMQSFPRQQGYYDLLTKWFSTQSQWNLVIARTLKSEEESLLGWLAVNYELGALTSSTAPLVGVIDSGSGSLQISFPVQNTQSIASKDYTDISIYDRHVSLFTHGFLGLGQDEIRSQYLDNSACFSKNYPLPNGALAVGDLHLCEQRMRPLINEIHQVNDIVQLAIQQNPDQTWYIIGGISAMLQQRPFVFDNNEFTSEELALKANQQVCQQDWGILSTIYSKNKYLFANCLNASYFYSLIVKGFGINQTQPIHFISNKISTNDWTLGVILYQYKR